MLLLIQYYISTAEVHRTIGAQGQNINKTNRIR
jgi:hypothetical protein